MLTRNPSVPYKKINRNKLSQTDSRNKSKEDIPLLRGITTKNNNNNNDKGRNTCLPRSPLKRKTKNKNEAINHDNKKRRPCDLSKKSMHQLCSSFLTFDPKTPSGPIPP